MPREDIPLAASSAARQKNAPETTGAADPAVDAPIRCIGLRLSLGTHEVLRGIDLTVRRGEILSIMGRTGSGKSSLLRCMIGLVRPTGGQALLFGEDVARLSEDRLNLLRRRAGMVFQSAALFDSLTVFENVAFFPRRFRKLSDAALRSLVAAKLALVEMEGTERHMPAELSGGMAKRVGIARALASEPEVILYDEPEAGLDPIMRGTVDSVIRGLRDSLGMTSVIVSHHVEHALSISDRVALLHGGVIHTAGVPDAIRGSEDPLVRQFITGSADGPLTDSAIPDTGEEV